MKYILLTLLFLFFGCKKIDTTKVEETNVIIEKPPISIEKVPELPEGAIKANFTENAEPFYAFIETININKQTTIIGFENNFLPSISIPESIGAELQLLELKNYTNDVLLVNAKLKDTNFNEYYVYVWNGSVWKQPVNRFDIHKSNMTDTLVPISNNPKDSTKLFRYYSVFDMDRESEKKFTWKLRKENVTIEK